MTGRDEDCATTTSLHSLRLSMEAPRAVEVEQRARPHLNPKQPSAKMMCHGLASWSSAAMRSAIDEMDALGTP
jgi:hypothetical protein